jgi:membrane protease YdiL (CAAX protease family)
MLPEPGERGPWGGWETAALVWIFAALAAAIATPAALALRLPTFTIVWLTPPLVMLLRRRDARWIGIRSVGWRELGATLAANLALWWLLMLLFEPWTHIYQHLIRQAISGQPPDATFGWLVRYPGAAGWVGMAGFSGFVTLFAEELCFRGWLLHALRRWTPRWRAITLQATLFTVPQLLVSFSLRPLHAAIWTIVYSWLAVSAVGGWAAERTGSIWPSLISATLTNLLLTILVTA